ncbi:uncharacterized protein BCR38DRAFT_55911 [Pseudomassariella vexata]|uniref:Uncharacterized protein n=1 Tax=Pseudomassariella vexata TaxID=1141098 RepID=A0A1Y2DLL4_9PEZI|nr:uncharacterized protein BCR38DRAFT_55911 [Pseudomassariella vexata]ORY60198.1 hypothetical protein BCR38DRAFT_55911 [Pseudomassariella vexata]
MYWVHLDVPSFFNLAPLMFDQPVPRLLRPLPQGCYQPCLMAAMAAMADVDDRPFSHSVRPCGSPARFGLRLRAGFVSLSSTSWASRSSRCTSIGAPSRVILSRKQDRCLSTWMDYDATNHGSSRIISMALCRRQAMAVVTFVLIDRSFPAFLYRDQPPSNARLVSEDSGMQNIPSARQRLLFWENLCLLYSGSSCLLAH